MCNSKSKIDSFVNLLTSIKLNLTLITPQSAVSLILENFMQSKLFLVILISYEIILPTLTSEGGVHEIMTPSSRVEVKSVGAAGTIKHNKIRL